MPQDHFERESRAYDASSCSHSSSAPGRPSLLRERGRPGRGEGGLAVGVDMARSVDAAETARDLWARARGNSRGAKGDTEVAEQLCAHLRAGLGRWVGSDGYRVLLDRAISQTRGEHPVLDRVSCQGGARLARGSFRGQDAGEIATGMVALVTALIELLGRIIGDEMAIRLVEQIGVSGAQSAEMTKRKAGRDG
jgi:hypothetical protein